MLAHLFRSLGLSLCIVLVNSCGRGTKDGSNWTLLNADSGFSKRSGNLLLNANSSLFTFGGYGLPMKHDAYCLSQSGGLGAKWLALPEAPWKVRA